VAVVAIDREAARALGHSSRPADWPRSLHARLIDALAGAGAAAVAFDLSFATPARDPADDQALAAALARAGNVVLLDFLEQREAGTASEHRIEQRLPPLPLLAAAAAAHGPFVLPKTQRVHGYWPAHPGAGWTTMPVLALRVYNVKATALQDAALPVADIGEEARYLDFYGPPRSVRTVGFHEVLRAAGGDAEGAAWLRQTFGGRAVFVGYSAAQPGEQDRIRDDYRTVFSRDDGLDLSGVEIAATAFANLVENRSVQPLLRAQQLALLLAFGLLLGALCVALRSGFALAAIAVVGGAYVLLAQLRFAADAQWLPLIAPLLVQAPLAVFGGALWHHGQERRDRRWLEALLQDLLPPVVVENLRSRIRNAAPAAEKELFGVFVLSDIQGYTSIAETLPPCRSTDGKISPK
jgi:adenylate cyclase